MQADAKPTQLTISTLCKICVTRQQTTTEERQIYQTNLKGELANQKVASEQEPITTF